MKLEAKEIIESIEEQKNNPAISPFWKTVSLNESTGDFRISRPSKVTNRFSWTSVSLSKNTSNLLSEMQGDNKRYVFISLKAQPKRRDSNHVSQLNSL